MDFIFISTIATAIATVAYAILTVVIVKETIRLRKVQTDPEIVLYLQPEERSPNFLDIVVKNVGSGAAYDLVWDFDRSSRLGSDGKFGISQIKFFDGIKYFAQGQEFRSFFASNNELFSEPAASAMKIQVFYRTDDGRKGKREFIIDPQVFYGRMWIGQPDVSESLKLIQRDISLIGSGFHKLGVKVYDKQDRVNERKELEKHRASLSQKTPRVRKKTKNQLQKTSEKHG